MNMKPSIFNEDKGLNPWQYSTIKMELLGKFIEANSIQKETRSKLLTMTTELIVYETIHMKHKR